MTSPIHDGHHDESAGDLITGTDQSPAAVRQLSHATIGVPPPGKKKARRSGP
jgi:hypothetical protein